MRLRDPGHGQDTGQCAGAVARKEFMGEVIKEKKCKSISTFYSSLPQDGQTCLFTVTVRLRCVRVNGTPSCMMPCGSSWKNSIWKANDTHTDRENPEQGEQSASPQALAAHTRPAPPCVSSPYGIVLASPRRLQAMSTTVSSRQQPLHSCHITSMGREQTSVFNVGFPS